MEAGSDPMWFLQWVQLEVHRVAFQLSCLQGKTLKLVKSHDLSVTWWRITWGSNEPGPIYKKPCFSSQSAVLAWMEEKAEVGDTDL